MSTLIYLFKTHQINISNLAQAQALENADTQCLDRCYYHLEGNKFFKITLGNFVTSHLTTPSDDFRTINWTTLLTNLDLYVDQAQQQGKFLISGTVRDDQISFLKQHYGSDILTIDVGYTDAVYQNLLFNLAELHLYRLTNNQLPITDIDQEILKTLSSDQAIYYYVNAFDQQQIIPKSSKSDCDYRIMIDDFTNKSAMSGHFTDIGLPFTAGSESFYDHWLANQTAF